MISCFLRFYGLSLLGLAMILGGWGCQPMGSVDYAQRLGDKGLSMPERLAADVQWRQRPEFSHEQRKQILHQIIREYGQSEDMQIWALRELCTMDPMAAKKAVAQTLPEMAFGPVLQQACDLIVTHQWRDLTPTLALSLRRDDSGIPLSERSEYRALGKLWACPPVKVLQNLVLTAAQTRVRIAALDILSEAQTLAEIKGWLLTGPSGDAFITRISWSVNELGCVPYGSGEHQWLVQWHSPAYRWVQQQAPKVVDQLTVQQREGLRLAHMPGLVNLAQAGPLPTLEALRNELIPILQARTHVTRTPAYPGSRDDVPDRIEVVGTQLCYGDWVILKLINEALTQPGVQAELARQIALDYADTSTEHGAVLGCDDRGNIKLVGYPPLAGGSDINFLPSEAMFRALAGGIALFHYHTANADNPIHAGPGEGDLDAVDRQRFNGVVVTPLSTEKLDVDVFLPHRRVISLGQWAIKWSAQR
jgi:hypothetical protein